MNPTTIVSTGRLVPSSPPLGVWLWLTLALPAAATSLQLSFTVPGVSNESNRQAVLEWNAEPARTYYVQSATNLAPGAEWKTEEPVRATSAGPVKWMAPEALRERRYYRLILPQTELFSLEPAWVDSGNPNALLYVTGQMLPLNGIFVINGQHFTPTQVAADGSWAAISLNGLPPGTPLTGSVLLLNDASNIVSTLPLQTPVYYGAEMTVEQLQGPPDEPPASPQMAWLSKKGYDYYKAKSDLTASGAQTNPYFQENKNDGDMPGAGSHGFVSKKGYDYYQAKGALGYEIQEGKKGLNAVNVKQAFTDRVGSPAGGIAGGVIAAIVVAARQSGELQCEETDLGIEGRGLDFAWTRTYRSRTGPTTAQGAGWDFSYNVSLAPQPDGTVVLRSGDGRASTFYPDGTNGWFRDEYFLTIGDLDQDGYPDVVTFADTGKWVFHPPGTAATGKLSQIIDRNGNTLTFGYDLAGRLTTIVDTLDRTNTVAYNPAGQIASVADFSGRIVRYEYDGNGDLVGCVSPAVTGTPTRNDFPGGKTNRYAYTSGFGDARLNHNLTACIDPKGQTWLTAAYQTTNNPASLDFDTVDHLVCDGTTHLRRFPQTPSAKNRFAIAKTIVCDAEGNVTECYYDSRLRCLRQLEFTGRSNPSQPVTESDNRPAGKLRADDPDYFETQWSWSVDSLCTRELRPGGDSTEIVHQRVQDHNSSRSNKSSRRHDGDVRVLRERASAEGGDLDGDGVAETTELAWYYEYDPRFGSPDSTARIMVHKIHNGGELPSARGKAFDGENTPIIKGSALGGHESAKVVTDRATGRSKGFGFVISATDPRGNISAADYDDHGNCLRLRRRPELLYQAWDDALDEYLTYNSHGQLTAVTNAADANGYRRVDTISYYAGGAQKGMAEVMVASAMAGGLALTTRFEYDARGNVTRVVDPRDNDWLYTYNALDECVRARTPVNITARRATDFIYDANGNVVESSTQLLDENDSFVRQVWSLAEYDLFDRCTSLAEQVSPGVFVTNRFLYDANGRLTGVLSPLAVSGADPANQVAFEYDERGLLFREIGAPGSGISPTNEYSYTVNGLRTRVDQLETILRSTSTVYDGFNRAVTVIDPMSNVLSYVYDRNGNCTRARSYGEPNDVPGSAGNRLLAETRFAYDSLDRCVQQADSFFDIFTGVPISDGAGVTTFTYAPNGACSSIADDNGHATRYTYDAAGRLASVTDPKTNVMTFSRDAGGNVTGMVSTERSDLAQGTTQFSRGYVYDSLGRCVLAVDNVGNTNTWAYDSLNRVARTKDAKGNQCLSYYDDHGRETFAVRDLNGDGVPDLAVDVNTSWTYDANSRRLSVTDDNTNTTTYAYDSLDRTVSETNPDGTVCSLVWSPRSNLLRVQDPNGTVVSNRYDLLDRCVGRDIIPGSMVATTTTFERYAYDGLSRLVAATNDASHSEFSYDSLGNLTSSRQDGWLVSHTHDAVGNPLSLTYPGGLVVTSTYDPLGQVTSVSSSSGGVPPVVLASYAYEGPGRLGRISRGNNINTRLQWNGMVSPPNGAGDFGWRQVRGVNHQASGGGAVIDQRIASYDRNQNRIRRSQTAPFFTGGGTTTNVFTYDALDRLTQTDTTAGGSFRQIAYQLDGNSNRQLVLSNGVAQAYVMSGTPPPGPADFQMDQYTFTPFGEQIHDDNGNLVVRISSAGQLQYDYDYADRLVLVSDVSGGTPVPVARFSYNALGQRNTIARYPPASPTPVVTTFIYAGGNSDYLEARTDGLIESFIHKLDDGLIVSRVSNGGPSLHYHTDDLGNVLALTDNAGLVLERYDYDDYGFPAFLTRDGLPTSADSSAFGNPFLFHGMEWDAETDLYLSSNQNPLYTEQGQVSHNPLFGGCYLDPQTGRATRGKVKDVKHNGMGFADNNPWSGGGPVAMKKGTVKFFNDAKGFGRVSGGGGGTKAQDHNSSRSNKTASIAAPGGGGGGGGTKAQDHNSSRSNKTASSVEPEEELRVKFIVKK